MAPDLLIAIAAVFVGVAVGTGTLTRSFLLQRSPARRRLEVAAAGVGGHGLVQAPTLVDTPGPLAEKISAVVPKSPREMSKLRQRLGAAGYRSVDAAIIFSALKLFGGLTFGASVFALVGSGGFLKTLFAAAVGFLLPDIGLAWATRKRQKVIRHGLPDALDLFIVCLEAGSSLDQAIVKASDELDIAYPALAEELRMITTEIRAGKPRLTAFKNFAERTRVDDVRSLVAMLVQTDRFGTSVAQALRTHADQARTKRRQVAEEKAAKLSVKLVFPLVLCLFPAMYVVVLGPAVIKIAHVFSEQK